MGHLFVLTVPAKLTAHLEHQVDMGLAESPEAYIIKLVEADCEIRQQAMAVLRQRCGGDLGEGSAPETAP
jgi:hypothetical protein